MNPWLIGTPAAMVAGAAVTAYGAVVPCSELFGSLVCRTSAPRKLAITFDDGPNPKVTPGLLKLLERFEVCATFFVIGRFVRECPELLLETVDRGHAVGNHTRTHPNLFWCTPDQIRAQLQDCNDAIGEVTGAAPKWFRPPFGMRNPWVIPCAAERGLRTVMFSRLPGDWRGKSAPWLIERMKPIARSVAPTNTETKHSSKAGGDILCVHDGDHRFLNGDRSATVTALEHWLPRWRDLGLEFVTIDEAVSAPAR